MPTVKGRVALCHCEDYENNFISIQGIKGRKLFDKIGAIENIITTRVDKNFQHFLAYPVVENEDLYWFSHPYNESPVQLSKLESAEREKYESIKVDTVNHYQSVINNLKSEGNTTESQILEMAIKFINDDFIYCFDNKVTLGIWGMQLSENKRQSLGYAVKSVFIPKPKPNGIELVAVPEAIEVPIPEECFEVQFDAGDNGVLNGVSHYSKYKYDFVGAEDVPKVEPKEGYEFIGWGENPVGHEIYSNKVFTAQYRQTPIIIKGLPWYLRFWNWLKKLFLGSGCLKWLLWLLLIILLLLLFSWLFKDCSCSGKKWGAGGADTAIGANDSTWMREDPNVGSGGGKYDPTNPYTPVPTPPGYEDVLPPQQGVLPPVEGTPEKRPGNPTIIGNRLNILMDNQDKSIMDLAKDFKKKYPDSKYKVVYYDNVVKRIQIEFPKEERETLKKEIPEKFAPEYELFVFDEALFEGGKVPNDPAFNNKNKVWYLDVVNAQKAWDISQGSDKITVAIVDNGFNLKHVELSSKVVKPYNVWKHSAEIYPQQVDHGTHVAGTALAIANNGEGISGIASGCKFMPVQVADERGIMTTTSVLDGVLYALYQGADVINVSLGSQFTGMSQVPENAQQEIIKTRFKEEERLWRHIMKIAANHNSTIVLAAGNDNVLAGIDAIQRPDQFVTVSATDKRNQVIGKAGFSNYGAYSTISAPGVGIYSTVGKDEYATMDGTSMAAPIVTGAIALMKSVNDKLSNKQIICILKNTGKKTNSNIGNLIQIDKALEKVKSGSIDDCSTIPEVPSTGDVQVLMSWGNYNDLDLTCTAPDGNSVWFKNKRVPSGGQLQIDMNVENLDSKNPIENIFWPKGSAPAGKYEVYLTYFKQHEPALNNTKYKLIVKYGSKKDEYTGTIKKEDKTIHICSFQLGSNNSSLGTIPINNRQNELMNERTRLQNEIVKIDKELIKAKSK